jgi:hypothetical protein
MMYIHTVTHIGGTTHKVKAEIKLPKYPWRKFQTLCGLEFFPLEENQEVTCKNCLRIQRSQS